MKAILVGALMVVSIMCSCTSTAAGDSRQVFADMERAIREQNESMFRKHWSDDAYAQNLVGRGGLEGSRLYQQGSRKKWFPQPDYSKALRLGKVEIVPTSLQAWESGKSVDEVFFAVAPTDNGPRIIGGGEDLDEVKKLAERFNSGSPLKAQK